MVAVYDEPRIYLEEYRVVNARAGRYMWGIVIGGLIMGSGVAAAKDGGMAIARTIAIQEIEYLRKSYARATDQIGQNTPASIAEGRATYHRIFTGDVMLRVKGGGIPASDTVGPDAWVDVVIDAV